MAEDLFKTPGAASTTTAPATTATTAKPAVTAPVTEAPKDGEPAKEAVQAPVAATTAPVTATPAVTQPAAQQTVQEPVVEEPDEEEEEVQQPSELDFLKKRADFMNIGYASDADVETLKAKIKAKMEGTDTQPTVAAPSAVSTDNQPLPLGATEPVKQISLRQYMQQEKMKLVRLRITNMDPKKADLQGEIITVANEYLGTVRKFVPFGEFTDNGFHVPYCIYEMLQERKFLSIKTKKGSHGTTQVESAWVKEFALEVLPPLTAEELARLATDQRAAGGLAENAI